MPWYVFAISYALLTSLHVPLIKRVNRDVGGLLFVFINAAFCMVPLGIMMWATGGIPHIRPMFWLYVTLTALIQFAGLRRAADAYTEGQISLIKPTGTLTPMLVSIFAMFWLRQGLTIAKIGGIVLIVIGAYVLESQREGVGLLAPFKSLAHTRTVRLYVRAQFIWAFFPLTLKPALDSIDPVSPYFVAFIMVGVMCLRGMPYRRSEWQRAGTIATSLFPWFCLSAAIVTAQQFVELTAYARADVGAVSAMFKLEIPLTILWGWLLFGEDRPTERLSGGTLMTLGAVLLAI